MVKMQHLTPSDHMVQLIEMKNYSFQELIKMALYMTPPGPIAKLKLRRHWVL